MFTSWPGRSKHLEFRLNHCLLIIFVIPRPAQSTLLTLDRLVSHYYSTKSTFLALRCSVWNEKNTAWNRVDRHLFSRQQMLNTWWFHPVNIVSIVFIWFSQFKQAHFCTMFQKLSPLHYLSYLCQTVTNFQNCFTSRLGRKFATKLWLNFPPRLKPVATLLCKILFLKIFLSIWMKFLANVHT